MGFLGSILGTDDAADSAEWGARVNRKYAKNAFRYTQRMFNPYYFQGTDAYRTLGNYLGVNGRDLQQRAFNNYQQGPDVKFRMQEGINAIDNSYAARSGGTDSGALRKAQINYGTGVATQDLQNFLTRLASMGAQGQSAAGSLSSAKYRTADMLTNATNAQSTALANASLAEGGALGSIIGGILDGGIFGYSGGGGGGGTGGFNPFAGGG